MKYAAILIIVTLMAFASGCSTVTLTAKEKAHCDFQTDAPFKVVCTSDGKKVLEWSGEMSLDVDGCNR